MRRASSFSMRFFPSSWPSTTNSIPTGPTAPCNKFLWHWPSLVSPTTTGLVGSCVVDWNARQSPSWRSTSTAIIGLPTSCPRSPYLLTTIAMTMTTTTMMMKTTAVKVKPFSYLRFTFIKCLFFLSFCRQVGGEKSVFQNASFIHGGSEQISSTA